MRADDDSTPALPIDGLEDRGPLLGSVQDAVRRMLFAGVGALFMTEEGIRTLVRELKLPKEAIGFVVAQADKTKADVTRVVGAELRKFLQSARLREELLSLLAQLTVEFHGEFYVRRRKPDEPGFVHHVKAGFRAPKKRRETPRKKRVHP